ncbi:hypothetical protein H8B06_17445 [Sphingobacterium sp. DN00404]|uniref:RiboL-PSP-HEPN domain-containing protein n=1 Tax=Sphingobacterium micropteri TaxID=2763501 RepID=A0ABR7YTL1_9SPHI|nr:hypothetical protein [Sphingobacterium micropteri]MBD1434614.1 hypothetical protein [Sphingobacterium micropteri]
MIMRKKPNLLVYDDLIEPILNGIGELNKIKEHYQTQPISTDFIDKGIFAYVIALFEGSINECIERYLFSFPEKLPKIRLDSEKYKNELLSGDFTYEFIAHLISTYISESSYDNTGKLLQAYSELLEIGDLSSLYSKRLREKKARRNSLIHNNLKVDLKYIWTTGADPRNKGKYMRINQGYVLEAIDDVSAILNKILEELEKKYSSYTILNAVKQVWNYLFSSPIMQFDDYWGTTNDMLFLKPETIKKYYKSLSSSERSLLFYFVQNYNVGAFEKIFKVHDLNMQVSNNHGMIFLVSVFDRYPLLLQNLKSIKPSNSISFLKD